MLECHLSRWDMRLLRFIMKLDYWRGLGHWCWVLLWICRWMSPRYFFEAFSWSEIYYYLCLSWSLREKFNRGLNITIFKPFLWHFVRLPYTSYISLIFLDALGIPLYSTLDNSYSPSQFMRQNGIFASWSFLIRI